MTYLLFLRLLRSLSILWPLKESARPRECWVSYKKRTKHLARKKPQGEGGSCHLIDFPGDFSARKISVEMISAADSFFFPQEKEWLQSLLFSKLYELSILSLYRVNSFTAYRYFFLDRFANLFDSFRGFRARLGFVNTLGPSCEGGRP